jgi:hypothetical protein
MPYAAADRYHTADDLCDPHRRLNRDGVIVQSHAEPHTLLDQARGHEQDSPFASIVSESASYSAQRSGTRRSSSATAV